MFDKFGKVQGYGQMAPGRDVEKFEESGQPGRPRKQQVVNSAISGGMPVAGAQPFQGAQQTVQPQGGAIDKLGMPGSIGTAIGGGIGSLTGPMDKMRQAGVGQQPTSGIPSPTAGLAQPRQALPLQAPAGAAPAQAPARDYGNDYKSMLMDANAAKAKELQGIADEGQREAAVEAHLRSFIPQLQAMGVNVGDVRKEKMQINGQWVDMFQDITNGSGTGAAVPQWLVEDGSSPQMTMPVANAIAGPQVAQTDGNFSSEMIAKILAELQGKQAPRIM